MSAKYIPFCVRRWVKWPAAQSSSSAALGADKELSLALTAPPEIIKSSQRQYDSFRSEDSAPDRDTGLAEKQHSRGDWAFIMLMFCFGRQAGK